jgi:hypothetical protein
VVAEPVPRRIAAVESLRGMRRLSRGTEGEVGRSQVTTREMERRLCGGGPEGLEELGFAAALYICWDYAGC